MFKQIDFTTWLLALLTFLALLLSYLGWAEQADALNLTKADAMYHAWASLIMDGIYLDSSAWNNDLKIEIGRWMGIGAFVLGATKAILALLSTQVAQFQARLRKNHLIIVGDDPMAQELATEALALGTQVTWLAAAEAQAHQQMKNLYVSEGVWSMEELRYFGVHSAKRLVITTGDSVSGVTIARLVREEIPEEEQLQIFVLVKYPWLTMRIDQIDGILGIRFFSNAQAAIRQIHRRHPPFLIAKRYGQPRIHAVLVGFGVGGESVLLDLILSCLVSYLDKPRFTIIDPAATELQGAFELRYPELHESAEFVFIESTVGEGARSISTQDFLAIGQDDPVTATYICLPDETRSLTAGLTIQALAERHNWSPGPIFVRLALNEALPEAPTGVTRLKHSQLIGFGGTSHMFDTGILSELPDRLARAMHLAYAAAIGDRFTVPKWEALAEDQRVANRRFITHIYAKLSSAGIDIEPMLADDNDIIGCLSVLEEYRKTLENHEIIEILSILEHERWMADRRINGWCRTPYDKDAAKRLHPDLVPFDQLPPPIKELDRLMIRAMLDMPAHQVQDQD